MTFSRPHSPSSRPGQSGTIIVILLVLMSLFAVITIGAGHSLARLRTEVLALEQRHAARTTRETPPQPATGPSTNPGAPAESPTRLPPGTPAR